MKKGLFSAFFLMLSIVAFGQDLPENPEPGKCYVRCRTPEVWKNEDVTILVSPEHKKIITYPAEYKTITEKVLIKEAGQRLVVTPAVWENRAVTYDAVAEKSKIKVIEAKFLQSSETIETRPESAIWEVTERIDDCDSNDPDDCRFWCYAKTPAKFLTLPIQKLSRNSYTEETTIPSIKKSYIKRVMVKKPETKVIEIPAEYATITKTVVVNKTWVEEVTVPPVYRTVKKEILVTKGGLTSWKEVGCELVKNTPIPINWDFSSAILNDGAKKIIDARLLPVLNTGVAVVIESHTDMRGTKKDNQSLSERRAKAVIEYLISKGINSSQLYAKGFGESKLLNKCSDGVECTEAEHAENRRTTFRVINQK